MQRNSVISFKNKDKTTANEIKISLFKEEKNMLPLEWRYKTFSYKTRRSIFISFFSVFYNCWSQSTRTKAISVFILFTEVATSIHLEKWRKLDWLPQDPQVFFPRVVLNHSQWNLAHMETFFLYHAKKGKMFFFKQLIILHMIISPWYISINFDVITNNFCVVDPFMSYMSYNLSASCISEQK